ncbi:DUF4105 domain-containing protein [Dokdonella sp.]|uniref:lipoprotein N-acyltransferase Lnb domain-containing protein n=1 Tax=Dokdonella sp. TaxID=2291710 RepID=UPI0027BA3B9C|nr:DUF4105 domain-containing protein [Dokdonella sp.]
MRPEHRQAATAQRRASRFGHVLRRLALLACAGVSAAVGHAAAEPPAAEPPAAGPAPLPAGEATPATAGHPAISLLTVGPGDIYFERFGHNAIVVRDPASGEALAYNYGMFDFSEAHFLANFVRGHMTYQLAANALDADLAQYRAEGRSVEEQVLDLAPAQAQRLVAFLEWNALPENARYRYDYFSANCSTRVRDALDRALGGALLAQSEGRSRGYTDRLDALRLMAPEPALMLLIDLGLGPYADRRIDFWDESFVPETLAAVVARARIGADAQPLVTTTRELAANHVAVPPALPPDLRWPFLGLGIGLGLGLHWFARRQACAARIGLATFAVVFESLCGLGGIALLYLWLGSDHVAAWRNENLLLLSPLCLLLVPGWIGHARGRRARGGTRTLAWLVVAGALFALASKILPWFPQANLHWIVLLLPIHLALALALGGAAGRTPRQ